MEQFRLKASQTQPSLAAKRSGSAHANGMARAHQKGNHRAWDLHGGVAGGGEKDVEAGQGGHGENL
jgi:hypothetical protein